MKLVIAALLCLLLTMTTNQANAETKSCFLVLENVPTNAVIRVSVFWGSNDKADEGIEDEGYIYFVSEGADSNPTISIWRQPFITHTFNFVASGPRVVIQGKKDPASTTHSEADEEEWCNIVATINSLPPWVKDYARIAFPYLGVTSLGLGTMSGIHPGIKQAASAIGTVAFVAKLYADDPIECVPDIARPLQFFGPIPVIEEVDSISIVGNKMARNASRMRGIALAAVTNANRANCSDFSVEQKLALFTAAQNQSVRVGKHLTRIKSQLDNLINLTNQAGFVVDEVRTFPSLEDNFYNFIDVGFSPEFDANLLQIITPDELAYLREGASGIPPIDFHNCINGVDPCRLYPDIWLEGAKYAFPSIEVWANSLKLKEVGQ